MLAALLAALNLAADPFGAFGDRLLSWFSYDETNNPRVAKFTYLSSTMMNMIPIFSAAHRPVRSR